MGRQPPGTTRQAPGCTLASASRAYQPGDSLLIERGSSYISEFLTAAVRAPPATASPSSPPVRTTLHASTAAPTLSALSCFFKDPSYVSLSNLEPSAAGAGARAQYREDLPGASTGNQSLEFTDLCGHHISGIGSSRVIGRAYDAFCGSGDLDLGQAGAVAVTGDFDVNLPISTSIVSGIVVDCIVGYDNLNV